MHETPAGPAPPEDGARAGVTERLQAAAASSVATIVVLNSVAFAKTDVVAQPQVTCIDACLPFLSPGAMAAAGTTLATLGAYALLKARKRDRSSEGEEKK